MPWPVAVVVGVFKKRVRLRRDETINFAEILIRQPLWGRGGRSRRRRRRCRWPFAPCNTMALSSSFPCFHIRIGVLLFMLISFPLSQRVPVTPDRSIRSCSPLSYHGERISQLLRPPRRPSPHSEAMNTSSSPPSSPAAAAVAGWAKRRLLGVSCLLACWRSPPPSPRSLPRPRWIKLRGIKMLICCHGAKKKESGRVRACLCVCTLQRGS